MKGKTNMKRISAILLCVLILTASLGALTSCLKEETAYDLISEAMSKTEKEDAFSGKIKIDMSGHIASQEFKSEINYDIDAIGIQSDNPTMKIKMVVSVLNEKVEMDMYLKDKFIYAESQGQQFKVHLLKSEEYKEMLEDANMFQALSSDFPQDDFPNYYPIQKNDDGSKYVTMSLNETMFNAMFGDILSSVNATLSEDMTATIMFPINTEIKVDKQGYLSEIKMQYSFSILFSGVYSTFNVNMTISYDKFGKSVEVLPLAGYENFAELDE